MSINHNKNVIAGSTVTVGGNLHIGDIVHQQSTVPSNTSVQALQSLIAHGKIEQAIKDTIAYTQTRDTDLSQEARHLSDRWQQLAKKRRMGTLSNADATTEHNQITAALLDLVERLG